MFKKILKGIFVSIISFIIALVITVLIHIVYEFYPIVTIAGYVIVLLLFGYFVANNI